MTPAVELHLHVRVAPGKRADFLAFLAEAVPFYERPGGIRVRLVRADAGPDRFIELVEYATERDYETDQRRVESDPELAAYLQRWRALLAEPPRVETYRAEFIPRPPVRSRQPVLPGPRLTLRPFTLDDCPDVVRLAGDRAIAATTSLIPHPYELYHAESWISSHPAEFEAGRFAAFVMTLTRPEHGEPAGTLVGAIGLTFKPEHDHAELGYWVGKPYWNRGYATEAARAILAYGFRDRALTRIHAHFFASNPASGAVMRKIGMSHEGTLRRHIKKWGEYQDAVCYAILREEFAA